MQEVSIRNGTTSASERAHLLLNAVCNTVGPDAIVAAGEGDFCDYLIQGLRPIKARIEGIVVCSPVLAKRLKAVHFPVYDFSEVDWIDLFIGGAAQVTKRGHMLLSTSDTIAKQKVMAASARQVICLAEQSQLVDYLGSAPLAVEVLPMAQSYVARRLAAMGGIPRLREDHRTDNGNVIIDVRNLELIEPVKVESQIKLIPGVVECGLFAGKCASKVLVAASDGLQIIEI
jgi:ribose 5-phosphate isomerase A